MKHTGALVLIEDEPKPAQQSSLLLCLDSQLSIGVANLK